MVLYLTRSHSFIRFRGYESAVWLPNKRSGSGVQPLAALYPTVTLSPWRQVRKNIHSRVWTPGPTWSVLHPGGPPLLVPLSSCTGGYGPHPRRLIRTPVQGGYPRYHSILSPPRRTSLLVPLSLDFRASLPPEFCPLPFVCFLCDTDIKHLCVKQCQLEEFINCPFANHVEGKLKMLLIRWEHQGPEQGY